MKIRHGWELTIPHDQQARKDVHPDVSAARSRRQAWRDNAHSRADREAARLRRCRTMLSGGEVVDSGAEVAR